MPCDVLDIGALLCIWSSHPIKYRKYKCGCVGSSNVTMVCNRTERRERPQRRERDDLHSNT